MPLFASCRHTHTHTHTHTHKFACTHTHTHTHTHRAGPAHTHLRANTHFRANTYISTAGPTHTHTHTHTYLCPEFQCCWHRCCMYHAFVVNIICDTWLSYRTGFFCALVLQNFTLHLGHGHYASCFHFFSVFLLLLSVVPT